MPEKRADDGGAYGMASSMPAEDAENEISAMKKDGRKLGVP